MMSMGFFIIKLILMYPMKTLSQIALFLFIAFIGETEASQANIIENYGKIPLSFTVNQGQLDPQVKFTIRGSGCTMYFTQEGTTFLLSRETKRPLQKE